MNKQEVISKLKSAIPKNNIDDYQRGEAAGLNFALLLLAELDEPVRPPEPKPLEPEKPVVPASDFILMQSTGLKDKNGKEIFEGDIVKYKSGCNTYTEEVAYDKNFAGFGVRDANTDIIFTFWELAEDIDLISLEVVGNIYENPELLEEE